MKVQYKNIYLNRAMPEDRVQRFILGIEDSDGPFAFFTTKLIPNYFIDGTWFQQPNPLWPGIKLILLLQSYAHGMHCFNWTLPIHNTILDEMYLPSHMTSISNLYEVTYTLVMKECSEAEYGTLLRFDGEITPRYDFEWWPPYGNEKEPIGETMQVAP